MRGKKIVQAGKCYHLVSRVAHRAYFLDDEEKDRFVDLLRRVEFFCCVRVLAYCCMSNHIHVFIYLEECRELSEDEILARVNALYRGARLEEALGEWKALKGEAGNGETAARILAFLLSGDKSRGEIAAELGMPSQPWLSRAYLSPLMERGYIAQTMPKKPKSPRQRYRLRRKGREVLA